MAQNRFLVQSNGDGKTVRVIVSLRSRGFDNGQLTNEDALNLASWLITHVRLNELRGVTEAFPVLDSSDVKPVDELIARVGGLVRENLES